MNVIFTESGKEAKLVEGRTILSYLQELEIDINASCGGEGKCGQCQIEVECASGALSDKTEAENEFVHEDTCRLACLARVLKTDEHIYVRVPRRTYYVLESGEYKEIALEPFVHIEGERVFCESEDVGEYTGEIYGIALDVGTTTLAVYLIDLESGKVSSVISRENPQTKYGNNVISRIEFARKGQDILEREIRTAANEMIATLTEPSKVYEMVVVGNPVMRDLFFGYSVESLGKSPYEPLSVESVSKTAKELGLEANPEARVYGLPLIGSFVGADALAVVLATEMYKSESDKICMAIDVGTNTEIALGNKDRLIATSCAAGPAFEGAGIACGIGGVSGAIREVKIENFGEVKYKTIDDAAVPVGVCGSGLIDALAELLDKKLIDGRGKFYGDKKELKIAEGITLSEKDIDQLNLAKTAVAVGIKVLLERYGVKLEDIDSIFLAGGFVNFTNTEHAIRIGLLPDVERGKVKKVGNAAVEGARQALISKTKREEAEAVAKRIEHVKLEEEDNFMELFVSELYFQKYL
uniref:Na(+)-translocating NADH-quinone reductase subunit F n=1 Tax=Candidatus Methanophagaceae archaeon ANME-1 ERB6 TaxID=2759912 RepID=A0A7G9YWS8_9EURY|nr:Na(+)-translocating NADH-quinone reductase subunit F [Methanosarcinales archaeon ANME-1 ERB6]